VEAFFLLSSVVTFQLKPGSASLLAFVSDATRFVSQAVLLPLAFNFCPAIARWVIERSNAWMERCKILVKNFERTLANATTKINLCFIRLMVKRLAASP
jgi:hypothetical protein